VNAPVEHYGEETRITQTAGQNEDGAPRVDSEPLDPELEGFPSYSRQAHTYEIRRLRKDRRVYDLYYAGTYYGAFVLSGLPSITKPQSKNATVSMRPTGFTRETRQGTLDNSGNAVKSLFRIWLLEQL